jgi:branched-chain amino acid transport system permease protein
MLAQQLINGLTQGSLYALMAIGFVLIFGTMNMVSFAHGETFMIGAFLGFFALQVAHLPFWGALLIACAGGWLVGVLTELLAFRTLRGAPHTPPLLITIGLSIILKEGMGVAFGYENHPMPSFFTGTLTFRGWQISWLQMVILIIVALLVACLQAVLYKTKIGLAIRAVSQDYRMAGLLGINIDRVFNVVFALASALGAVAGVLVAVYYNAVSPSIGVMPGFKGFATCIFGGLTSIPGAILAGMLIGIIENLTVAFVASGYKDIIAFLILILVLLLRPQGILGKKIKVY